MALLGEAPNVISERFTQRLSATLHVLGVARLHIHSLKVVDEDVLEIFPTVDDVSRQMIQPGPSRVGYINGEELDNKKVIICPARPTRKTVVLQPNAGVSFDLEPFF
jgi:hypothetical protein